MTTPFFICMIIGANVVPNVNKVVLIDYSRIPHVRLLGITDRVNKNLFSLKSFLSYVVSTDLENSAQRNTRCFDFDLSKQHDDYL